MRVYHGTSTSVWEPQSSGGYLYVSRYRSHAEHHARERADSCGGDALIVCLDMTDVGAQYERGPDNDCHGMDGYAEWTDSLNDKGSFVIVGDISELPVVCEVV